MNCGGSVNLDLGRKYLSFITQEWHTYGGVHVFRGEALEHLVAAVKAERGSKESLCEVKASLGLPTRGICLHCLQGIASGLYQEWVPVGYELKPAAAITVKGTLDLRILQAYFEGRPGGFYR